MSDIAVYSKPAAQPTSGAGAIALLLGPNPVITISSLRTSIFQNAYDFYKPEMENDYPIVNGKLSTDLYIKAMIKCWEDIQVKKPGIDILDFDYFCFHCPFTKQVRKTFIAFLFHEFKSNPGFRKRINLDPTSYEQLESKIRQGVSFYDRTLQSLLKRAFKKIVKSRLEPGLELPSLVGNIYTGSLYLSLISLFYNLRNSPEKLENKNILLYSYGSGLASSILLLKTKDKARVRTLIDSPRIERELENVSVFTCKEYFKIFNKNFSLLGKKNFGTLFNSGLRQVGIRREFWNDAYYLKRVDNDYIRQYVYVDRAGHVHPFFPEGTRKLSALTISNLKTPKSSYMFNPSIQSNPKIINKSQRQNSTQNFLLNSFPTSNDEKQSGFKKLRRMKVEERQSYLEKRHNMPGLQKNLQTGGLTIEAANAITENCIGKINMPVSMVQDLMINGKSYSVPMSTEEPSVVAAANRSSKLIREKGGGFWGKSTRNVIRGQIYVVDFEEQGYQEFIRKNVRSRKPVHFYQYHGNLGNNKTSSENSKFQNLVLESGFETSHIVEDEIQNHSNYDTFKKNPNSQIETEIIRKLDMVRSIQHILREKNSLIEFANDELCRDMFKRGGGAMDLYCKIHDKTSFSISLMMDVVDAMGANTINTTLEGLKIKILSLLCYQEQTITRLKKTHPTRKLNGQPVLMSIVSNLVPERVTRVGFRIPVEALKYSRKDSPNGTISGLEVCERICTAHKMAKLDIFRTVTHNKGIMNGIDAVLLCMGQDFRAVEAGCHVYSIYRNGQYQPFSDFYLHEDATKRLYLCAELEMPLSLGAKGGVIKANKLYQQFFQIMNIDCSKEFGLVVACIGLCNNLAALRALVTEGIQKGHMKLHARSIAQSVGVPQALISQCIDYMLNQNEISERSAQDFLRKTIKKRSNMNVLATPNL